MPSKMVEMNREFDIDGLFESTMQKKWGEVLVAYQKFSSSHRAKLTKSEDTALHIAVSSYHADLDDANERAEFVRKLVDALPELQAVEILGMKNDTGNTPLHLAAALGSVLICKCIASKGCKLISHRNSNNETPLFLAAQHGRLGAFLSLREHYNKNRTPQQEPDDSLCRRKDGYNILHAAISGEYFELAYHIIHHYPKLVNSVNEEGYSPLHILAKKPSVFQSSCNLRLCDRIIYHCLIVHELKKKFDVKSDIVSSRGKSSNSCPENYQTCLNLILLPWSPFKLLLASVRKRNGSSTDEEKANRRAEESQEQDNEEDSFPPNYATCIHFFKVMMDLVLIILGIGISRIKKIREKKKRHKWAFQIMNELVQYEKGYKYDHNGQRPTENMEPRYADRIKPPDRPPEESDDQGTYSSAGEHSRETMNEEKDENRPVKEDTHALVAAKMKESQIVDKFQGILPEATQELDPQNSFVLLRYKKEKSQQSKKETPILVAAKMGITEMVEKIFKTFPVAIQDLDANGKNALLLAVENRQTKVYELLMKNLPEFVLYQVDNEGNGPLHLAAMFQQHQPWRIPGAALQMQWEIKWYKHIKNSMPPQCSVHSKYNKNGETARQLFTRTHEKLVKDGSEWITKTSESCSVVAALIAGVAFATSTAVPGGVDQDTGRPILEDQPAFNVFSIASVIALCFSVTALVLFLAILTSRCQEKDFRGNLPRKLLLGLSSLFTSIAAILVSFCAGHFYILKQELHNAAFLIYTVTCLPITFFAFAQLPLYFDLLWSITREVPLRSYKVHYQ